MADSSRIFELRTYHAHPGRLDAMLARFRDHTTALFAKNGLELIGYWVPVDSDDTLVYMLAFPSREEAEARWAKFRDDPDWQKARADSEQDGPIVAKVESVYMNPTDFSPSH